MKDVKEMIGRTRLMTNAELKHWLSEVPHRERMSLRNAWEYDFEDEVANDEIPEGLSVRENYGEWVVPMVKTVCVFETKAGLIKLQKKVFDWYVVEDYGRWQIHNHRFESLDEAHGWMMNKIAQESIEE